MKPASMAVREENKMTRKNQAAVRVMAIGFLVSTLSPGPSALFAASGKSGAGFLQVGVGARASGMGGAFGAISDDVSAIYWNPAGLSSLQKKEINLSINAYIKDTSSQFLAFAMPWGESCALGVGVNMLSVKDIEKRSTTDSSDTADGGTFKTSDMALSLAFAHKFSMGSGNLHWGVALKNVSSDLGTESASSIALDGGVKYAEEEGGLSASLAVVNLGGELKFVDVGDSLPMTVKPGVAYRMNLGETKLIAALDIDLLLNDGETRARPGVEWWVKDMLAVRAGLEAGRDAGGGFSAGVGFKQEFLGIDYGISPYGDLGTSHRISISYRF